LWDALKTGQGATADPLFLSITTAGFDRHSICFDVWNRARQVRDGESNDPYFLPLLYELGDKEPWDDESTVHR
jgi:phage terminase large subunit-like protein